MRIEWDIKHTQTSLNVPSSLLQLHRSYIKWLTVGILENQQTEFNTTFYKLHIFKNIAICGNDGDSNVILRT